MLKSSLLTAISFALVLGQGVSALAAYEQDEVVAQASQLGIYSARSVDNENLRLVESEDAATESWASDKMSANGSDDELRGKIGSDEDSSAAAPVQTSRPVPSYFPGYRRYAKPAAQTETNKETVADLKTETQPSDQIASEDEKMATSSEVKTDSDEKMASSESETIDSPPSYFIHQTPGTAQPVKTSRTVPEDTQQANDRIAEEESNQPSPAEGLFDKKFDRDQTVTEEILEQDPDSGDLNKPIESNISTVAEETEEQPVEDRFPTRINRRAALRSRKQPRSIARRISQRESVAEADDQENDWEGPKLADGSSNPYPGGDSDASPAARAAGFLVGTIIGTPVAMVRSSLTDLKRGSEELSGHNGGAVGGGIGVLLFPWTAIGGLVQGPFYSMENAWRFEPFTKDSFSMGEEFQ